jgi:hypothetical protein
VPAEEVPKPGIFEKLADLSFDELALFFPNWVSNEKSAPQSPVFRGIFVKLNIFAPL